MPLWVDRYISPALFRFGAAFPFAASPFAHPVADPIAQIFGVEVHAGAATGEFEPGGESARPAFVLDPHFVLVIGHDLATGHADGHERAAFGERLEDVLDVGVEFA